MSFLYMLSVSLIYWSNAILNVFSFDVNAALTVQSFSLWVGSDTLMKIFMPLFYSLLFSVLNSG